MRKPVPTVTASVAKLLPAIAAFAIFILLTPHVVQSQPPAGATGPDAATTALVATACSSCHSLDRVNNKKADVNGWTTTVNRMRGLGADLTDEQVPRVAEYLAKNAGTLPVADLGKGGGKGAPGGKGGGKGGKGGGGGKNIQVLQGADLPATMQSFVQALGLLDKGTCEYCHVEGDRPSDAKPQKVTARRMVIMMRAINGTFADGKQHVSCYTCHRGSTTPPMTP
jgi:hypothetical protein